MRSLARKPSSAAAGKSRPFFSPRPSFRGRATAGRSAFFDPGAALIRRASARGGDKPLPEHTRSEMEASFGTDLSHVRIHDDEHAARLSSALDARAFTHGADVYFNRNEFRPGSPEGKHLLAHELTHVLQQQAAGRPPLVQRRTFTPGRPAHNHKPGHWAAVQSAARGTCLLTRDSIECTCAVASPATVLNLAMWAEMSDKPLARQHLEHYLSGGGKTLIEDAPLEWLLENDAKIRKKLAAAIAGTNRGTTAFWQRDYEQQDARYAWGGVDRVDFEVDKAAGTVDVWFKDRYDFHPVGFGYVNKGRGDHIVRRTNCVHAAAVELKASGAADYWMQGEATVPLSLFKKSSTTGPGSGSTD